VVNLPAQKPHEYAYALKITAAAQQVAEKVAAKGVKLLIPVEAISLRLAEAQR
jgi:hypothetical protein